MYETLAKTDEYMAIESRSVMTWEWGMVAQKEDKGGITERRQGLLAVMTMFTVLTVAIGSQIYACVKPMSTLNMCSLLHVNFASIMLIKIKFCLTYV